MIEFEALLHQFRTSGANATVWIKPGDSKALFDRFALALWGSPEALATLQTPAFLEALKVYQSDFTLLLSVNSIHVCTHPNEHRPSYRYTSPVGNQEDMVSLRLHDGFSCGMCTELRTAKIAELQKNEKPVIIGPSLKLA